MLIKALILLLLSCSYTIGANILFFHSLISYSHRVLTYPLADALEKRGHHVTYISPYHPRGPYINPNIIEIVPKKQAEFQNAFLSTEFDINLRVQKRIPRNVFAFLPAGIKICNAILSSPEILEFFKNTKKVDLLIMDNSVPECGMAIAYHYNAKFIYFATTSLMGMENDFLGIPPESSAIPEMEMDPPEVPMSFLERVFNTLVSIHYRYEHVKYVREIDKIVSHFMTTKLDPKYKDMPYVGDLSRNFSLVLYSADILTDFPRSHPPMMINVGGIHCTTEEAKELPEDIKTFLGEDDFIYISLGSLVVSSNLPDNVKQVFFDTISSFPDLKFLWKWNGPFPDKIPKNLLLRKWFPQVDLLKQPGIKGFVTQTGRPSMTESICSGVPMISFPVLGDQDVNAQRLNKLGANVLLELGTVTTDELKAAVQKVAYDERMKVKLKELQKLLLDKPMSAISTGVWWTEYVLRHKDTSHLKSASFDQYWFQRRHIDIWAFLYTIVLLLVLFLGSIIVFVTKMFMKIIFKSSKNTCEKTDSVNIRKKLN